MTLKIAGKSIEVSDIESKNNLAKQKIKELIETPQMSDRKIFLSMIEEHLWDMLQYTITIKEIIKWIRDVYRVEINYSYLGVCRAHPLKTVLGRQFSVFYTEMNKNIAI